MPTNQINNMEQILQLQTELHNSIKNFKLTVKAQGESILKEALAAEIQNIKTKYPDFPIHNFRISWTQYTPYFNDGDSCVFSSHFESYALNYVGTDIEGLEEDNYEGNVQITKYRWDETLRKGFMEPIVDGPFYKWFNAIEMVYEALDKTIGQLDSDSFEVIWGDHSEITYSFETNSFNRDDCVHD